MPLVLMLFTMTGCGGSNDVNRIIIGIDDDFPPMTFYDETGKLVGFDIDLATETVRRMGVEVKFQPINWDDKETEITSGHVDIIWNGLDITDERKEYMLFSKPYMDDRQIILVKSDSELDIHSEYDLKDKVVGTQIGSTSDEYINSDKKLKESIKDYKTYSKFSETVAALKAGEVDLVVCDELIARYEMNTYPNQLKILNVRIGDAAETGVGFRKDDIELRDKVQAAFDTMIKDGTANEISMKWFNADLIKH